MSTRPRHPRYPRLGNKTPTNPRSKHPRPINFYKTIAETSSLDRTNNENRTYRPGEVLQTPPFGGSFGDEDEDDDQDIQYDDLPLLHTPHYSTDGTTSPSLISPSSNNTIISMLQQQQSTLQKLTSVVEELRSSQQKLNTKFVQLDGQVHDLADQLLSFNSVEPTNKQATKRIRVPRSLLVSYLCLSVN